VLLLLAAPTFASTCAAAIASGFDADFASAAAAAAVLLLQVLDDYFSAAVGGKSTATRRSRFASFPPVLVIALKRYYVAGRWQYTMWLVAQVAGFTWSCRWHLRCTARFPSPPSFAWLLLDSPPPTPHPETRSGVVATAQYLHLASAPAQYVASAPRFQCPTHALLHRAGHPRSYRGAYT
jgi:hypothetical protein